MKSITAALLILLASCPVPPPNPQPTPTPSPTPSPSPFPSPSPPTACSLPAPQDQFTCMAGSPTLSGNVKGAVLTVVTAFSSHFEVLADGNIFLLTDAGVRAKNEEPGAEAARQWFYAAVVAELQKGGFCAGAFGTDAVVVGPDQKRFQLYSIVNHGGGNVRYNPPGYSDDCVPPSPPPASPEPTPSVSPVPPTADDCPSDAPPLNKIKIEGRRLASLIIDLTPFAHDRDFCVPINGQLDCPYGAETPDGMKQRKACEARFAPYTGFWNGAPCDGSNCENNDGNPLQFRIAGPSTTAGIFKVCSGGRCWNMNCSFDSPVCQPTQ